MSAGIYPRPPIAERLSAKLEPDLAGGCQLWSGAIDHTGYGRISDGGRHRAVHRVAYEVANGAIPTGLVIDHLCRTPLCCNPAHMEAVTVGTNTLRGTAPAAQNIKKTHCKYGHPLSGDNLYRWKTHRNCRACNRAFASKRRKRSL